MTMLYFFDTRTLIHLPELTREAEVIPGIGIEQPHNALTKAPPVAPEGKVVVVSSRTKWTVVDDLRGTVYEKATGKAVEHDMPGALPDELTAVAPGVYQVWGADGWVTDIEQLRAARVLYVRKRHDALLAAGFMFRGKLVEADESSQGKINGAVSMAMLALTRSEPYEITWTCSDNSHLTLDTAGMLDMGKACGEFVTACFYRQRVIKDALLAATTEEEINAVDIENGWPL